MRTAKIPASMNKSSSFGRSVGGKMMKAPAAMNTTPSGKPMAPSMGGVAPMMGFPKMGRKRGK